MSATLLKQERVGKCRTMIIAHPEDFYDGFDIYMCVKALPTSTVRWSILRRKTDLGFSSFVEIEATCVPSDVIAIGK